MENSEKTFRSIDERLRTIWFTYSDAFMGTRTRSHRQTTYGKRYWNWMNATSLSATRMWFDCLRLFRHQRVVVSRGECARIQCSCRSQLNVVYLNSFKVVPSISIDSNLHELALQTTARNYCSFGSVNTHTHPLTHACVVRELISMFARIYWSICKRIVDFFFVDRTITVSHSFSTWPTTYTLRADKRCAHWSPIRLRFRRISSF